MANYPSNDALISGRKSRFLPTATLYHADKPLQLVKAQGNYVWDSEGKRYLDAIGGIICISAGHNHPKIKAKLREMLDADEPQHLSTLYLNRHAQRLADKLTEHAPKGLDRWHFTNSGSEANEAAFLAARHATGETIVMNLKHGYHGGTSGALASCGHSTWRFRGQPVAQTVSAAVPYCYRCPYGATPGKCALECAQDVEATIQTATHGKLAAFIAEPVMGVGGFIDPPKEYFHAVCKTVKNYGAKYISDEVQTGVGRCGGDFFLTKELGIDADMISMAKGLGNGAAIGAVVMKSDVADTLAGKSFFNTFGADPYQTEQAALTVEIIEEEKMIANAKARGAEIKTGLQAMMEKHPIIGDVRGRGLLLGFELVKDRVTKEHAPGSDALRLMDLCKDRGLLLGRGGLKGNVMRVAPPLGITKDEAGFILKVIDESLAALARGN